MLLQSTTVLLAITVERLYQLVLNLLHYLPAILFFPIFVGAAWSFTLS